jgi:hypothetical protein
LQTYKRKEISFFNKKGEQAQGQIRGQTNENVGALQRRFTSMGAGNTGAAIAAESKAREAGLEQERQALGDIAGQQLQAGEADFGRQFQAEEAGRGREFQAAEARMARDAQLSEAEKARQFQAGMADKDIASKKYFFDTENANKMRELDMAYEQFLLDKDTTAFNRALAEHQAGGGFRYNANAGTYTSNELGADAAKKAREDQVLNAAANITQQGGTVNVANLPRDPQFGYTHGSVRGGGTGPRGIRNEDVVWDAFQKTWVPVSQFKYDPNIIGISDQNLALLRQGRAQGTYGNNNLMPPANTTLRGPDSLA